MFVCTIKFDKKKAVFIIVMAALVLFGIIMLLGIGGKGKTSVPESDGRAGTESKRLEYLSSLGWNVETPALSVENVLIPKSFSDVFLKYNELQKTQGFDLSKYAGKEVQLYTYRVTNHESKETVLAELYVYKDRVIGGDIHSSALDGFMHGLKNKN